MQTVFVNEHIAKIYRLLGGLESVEMLLSKQTCAINTKTPQKHNVLLGRLLQRNKKRLFISLFPFVDEPILREWLPTLFS